MAFDGEGQLTAAVNYVASEVNETVYTLTGHGRERTWATSAHQHGGKGQPGTMAAEPLNLLMDRRHPRGLRAC